MNVRTGIIGTGLRLASLCLALFLLSGCAPETFVGEDGAHVAAGTAQCVIADEKVSYDISVHISTDDDGVIVAAGEGGTEVPEGSEGQYRLAQKLYPELLGRTREDLASVDSISGATCSCQAILDAAAAALDEIAQQPVSGDG